jgi:hypothetical protein
VSARNNIQGACLERVVCPLLFSKPRLHGKRI